LFVDSRQKFNKLVECTSPPPSSCAPDINKLIKHFPRLQITWNELIAPRKSHQTNYRAGFADKSSFNSLWRCFVPQNTTRRDNRTELMESNLILHLRIVIKVLFRKSRKHFDGLKRERSLQIISRNSPEDITTSMSQDASFDINTESSQVIAGNSK
jgi:hypothetical protein